MLTPNPTLFPSHIVLHARIATSEGAEYTKTAVKRALRDALILALQESTKITVKANGLSYEIDPDAVVEDAYNDFSKT